MKTVLIYSEEYKQLEKMLDVLELNGFNSIPCLSPDDVKQCINLTSFDLLIIGDSVNENSRQLIKNEMKQIHPTISISEHFGPIDNLINDVKQSLGIN